ncbi:hypothetical protein TWF173_002640 [Orbilia oligospora]|uniref:Uncharacterized protein n=1 Tax=Orbilia oligospora TaxID=2813651 RepID=A0A7C8R3Y9_ORBOL|nr:hypothetical protein TWF970_008422 [Orbilia oligospora]KAF3307639.1 hypothetical protein TWF173_002640 [Orbilia oligospora]
MAARASRTPSLRLCRVFCPPPWPAAHSTKQGLSHPIKGTTVPFVHRRFQSGHGTPGGTGGGNDYQLGPSQEVQPQPNTQSWGESGQHEEDFRSHNKQRHDWRQTAYRMLESAATTGASLAILGLAGFGYHKYYKNVVLQKINNAFEPGDPVLELAAAGRGSTSVVPGGTEKEWIVRPEQDKIDKVVAGETNGHYYLLLGEKGCGKTSMILDAMQKVDGLGIAMMECHADLEIFRIRLGKALDFEFHEDYIGSLFSIRGPRDTTALLDIERAFNKLEKVALKRKRRTGQPLVLIFNSMHLLRDDEDGLDLIELLQQRAEAWAATGLCTVLFCSDDYIVYEKLKHYASRMELITVQDLPKDMAISALRRYRAKHHANQDTEGDLERIYQLVGGRLSYLSRVAQASNMEAKANEIIENEERWLLTNCGLLGEGQDDDVNEYSKFASAAMVLCRALVAMEDKVEGGTYNEDRGWKLPQVPLHIAREIMTRADFIHRYDHLNLFTIDSKANVRADSVPMALAMRKVCKDPRFDQLLEDSLERIGDVESLGRTREITLKDLWESGKYEFTMRNAKGYTDKVITFTATPAEKPDGDEDSSDKK